MEVSFGSIFSSWSAYLGEEVHPALLHAITLLIPMNIYIIGDWLGAGIQWALFRYQETYLGRNFISIFTDAGYILGRFLLGKSALSTEIWILGALLLVLGLIIALVRDGEASRRVRGGLLISASLIFLIAKIIQYGPFLNGVGGAVIPVGIPVLFTFGLLIFRGKSERFHPPDGGPGYQGHE